MLWTWLPVPAMVAHELAAKAMLDQPARTMRTPEAIAADPAQRKWRIAAPAEEQQRLLARGQCRPHPLDEHRRQEAAALGRMAAHVDRHELRQRRIAETRRQGNPVVAALICIDPAFHRWRRRGKHDRETADPGAHDRHVPRMIGDAVLLLVGRIMLLVDN